MSIMVTSYSASLRLPFTLSAYEMLVLLLLSSSSSSSSSHLNENNMHGFGSWLNLQTRNYDLLPTFALNFPANTTKSQISIHVLK